MSAGLGEGHVGLTPRQITEGNFKKLVPDMEAGAAEAEPCASGSRREGSPRLPEELTPGQAGGGGCPDSCFSHVWREKQAGGWKGGREWFF